LNKKRTRNYSIVRVFFSEGNSDTLTASADEPKFVDVRQTTGGRKQATEEDLLTTRKTLSCFVDLKK
jgi:hypothetical protein